MKYKIRFNKTRGMDGRGTVDHVWRIFENGNENLVKHFRSRVDILYDGKKKPLFNAAQYCLYCFVNGTKRFGIPPGGRCPKGTPSHSETPQSRQTLRPE